MANRNINATLKPRRDTAANWETKNPVLDDGEFITVYTASGAIRHKVGDGVKTYSQLPFEDEPLYNALAGKCDASNYVTVTLLAANWSNGDQTVAVTGLGATQNGIASYPQSITTAQYEAMVAAELMVTAQSAGSLTFSCHGDTPQIDIPVCIILLG